LRPTAPIRSSLPSSRPAAFSPFLHGIGEPFLGVFEGIGKMDGLQHAADLPVVEEAVEVFRIGGVERA
jgi:hypothetical protein